LHSQRDSVERAETSRHMMISSNIVLLKANYDHTTALLFLLGGISCPHANLNHHGHRHPPGRRHHRHPARRSRRVNPSRAGNSQVLAASLGPYVLRALNKAALIVGHYREPGHPRDPVATMNRLIEVLDDQKLAAVIKRMEIGAG
jgi:hypothetical protein